MNTSVLITPPIFEPLTLDQGKLRAGLDWPAGDPRDDLMKGFIATARLKVEHDTGLALPAQTHDVYIDQTCGGRISMPSQTTPILSVTSITATTVEGVSSVLTVDDYLMFASGPLVLASGAARSFIARLVSGHATPAAIPAPLVHAVGLLVAHYATFGRDAIQVGHTAAPTPYGYDETIAPYILVSLI